MWRTVFYESVLSNYVLCCAKMENEIPKGTTNQPLIQFIRDAAVFTDTSFIITACNKMAATLFNYRQHDVSGFHIPFLTPASSAINTQQVSLKDIAFKQGIITYVNKADKITLAHITRHAIDPESINGGFLFIYKPLDQDKQIESSSPISNGQLRSKRGTTTISTYRARILSKMNFKNNTDLIRYALEKKLV